MTHYLTSNPWVLAAGIGVLSLALYFIVTSPRRQARRLLRSMDAMDGVEFERWVAALLKLNGYKRVQATAATADYGADLVARQGGQTCIFQCKRYAKNCGVQAVQEICGAKAHYGSDVEVVVTNAYFTKNAVILAGETGVQLWDRDTLMELAAFGRRHRAK